MPNIQFQFRRGTAAQWTAANPTLAAGEMGTESDTGKFKIGTGILPWNSLLYGGLEGPQGSLGVTGSQGNVGLQGNQGSQGIQGVTGPQGVQGLQGDPGGPTGPTGNFSGVVLQSILPAVSAAYDIGATGASFRDLYFGASKLSVSNSTLQFSDPTGSVTNLGASTNWAQFPAIQNVDMSGYVISNTSGFSISNNSIAGVSNINGQPLTDLGGVNWATFRAVQNVDMSGNALINVSRILDASGSAAAPSYAFTADASTGIHYNGASQLSIDSSGQVVALFDTSAIRLQEPTEYRRITSDVSGTSLALSSNYFSTVFRLTNAGFNTLTIPTLTAAQTGAFWTLSNTTSSFLPITFTGTLDVSSPFGMAPNSSADIFWNGTSNYLVTQPTTAGADFPTFTTISNGYVSGSRIVFTGASGGAAGSGAGLSTLELVIQPISNVVGGRIGVTNSTALTDRPRYCFEFGGGGVLGIYLGELNSGLQIGTYTSNTVCRLVVDDSNVYFYVDGTVQFTTGKTNPPYWVSMARGGAGQGYFLSLNRFTPTQAWSTFSATQNVNMNARVLSNVGRILDASGSAAAPSYSFTADASTGIHYTGSAMAFDVSGVQRMTVSSSNVTVSNPLFARMPVTEVSGTSVTLASSNYSTYFYVTNSGFNAVTLPSTTATADAGAFWTLMNATSSSLSITLTNTLNLVSPLIIPSNNAQSLVVSAATSNTILLL